MNSNPNLLQTTLIVLLSLGFLSFLFIQEDRPKNQASSKIQWVSIDQAQELVKKEPRKVFVDVYTLWCGPCKLMDKTTFTDQNVIEYVNQHYYAVKLNAESTKKISYNGKETTEKELAKTFKVIGYPTIIFIDEKFENINPQLGYVKASQFKKMLIEFNGDV